MKKGSVMILNVNPGFLPMEFVQCLVLTLQARQGTRFQAATSAIPDVARTRNGRHFLMSDAEWALLIDSDMVWEPGAVHRLLQTAKEQKAKVVSGVTFMEHEQRVVPHAYAKVKQGDRKVRMAYAVLPSKTQPFKVDAVGGACLLVHRDVYQDLADIGKDLSDPLPFQSTSIVGGEVQGEDITFSERVTHAGYDIWYEPRAVFGHKSKSSIIGFDQFTRFLDARGIDHRGGALS